MTAALLPCPFCGGPVKLEATRNSRPWWGVVCRNTLNLGGTCAIQQIPSGSAEAAVARWNRRAGPSVTAAGVIEYQVRDPGLEVWRRVSERDYEAHEYYKRRVIVLEAVK